MKKKYFLVTIALVLVGCSTPERRAQGLIKAHLKENLHDFGSYESIKFGELDSVYTTVLDNSEYTMAMYLYDAFEESRKESLAKVNKYLDYVSFYGDNEYVKDDLHAELQHLNQLTDSTTLFLRTMAKIEKDFIPSFKGWSMSHTFRANNAMGAKIMSHKEYIFDKDITRVLSEKDSD